MNEIQNPASGRHPCDGRVSVIEEVVLLGIGHPPATGPKEDALNVNAGGISLKKTLIRKENCYIIDNSNQNVMGVPGTMGRSGGNRENNRVSVPGNGDDEGSGVFGYPWDRPLAASEQDILDRLIKLSLVAVDAEAAQPSDIEEEITNHLQDLSTADARDARQRLDKYFDAGVEMAKISRCVPLDESDAKFDPDERMIVIQFARHGIAALQNPCLDTQAFRDAQAALPPKLARDVKRRIIKAGMFQLKRTKTKD